MQTDYHFNSLTITIMNHKPQPVHKHIENKQQNPNQYTNTHWEQTT